MKADFDTIIYLLITIAILVISGLGSRRKRRLQQTQAPPRPDNAGEGPGKTDTEPAARTAFDELRDRFMSDLYPQDKMQARTRQASDEVFFETPDQPDAGQQSGAGQQPVVVTQEEEPPEEPVEEEEIMKEIRKGRGRPGYGTYRGEAMMQPIETLTEEIPQITGLFEGKDEIKKAIIYSVVLKRKY